MCQRLTYRVVTTRLRLVLWSVQPTGASHQAQQAARPHIERGAFHTSGLHRFEQSITHHSGRTGHFEIETRSGRRIGFVGPTPIRNHDAIEAPAFSQHFSEQPLTAAAVLAIQAVVRTHDRPRTCLADRAFEGTEIDLAKRARVDVRRNALALEFGFIADEVLETHGDASALNTARVGDRKFRGEMRILRVALEIAPRERTALQIDCRPEKHVNALGPRLLR